MLKITLPESFISTDIGSTVHCMTHGMSLSVTPLFTFVRDKLETHKKKCLAKNYTMLIYINNLITLTEKTSKDVTGNVRRINRENIICLFIFKNRNLMCVN